MSISRRDLLAGGAGGLAWALAGTRGWAAGRALDTAYVNAIVWTGQGMPARSAIGVADGRIAAIGAVYCSGTRSPF